MDSKYQFLTNELGSLRVKQEVSLKDYFGSRLDYKSKLFFMATTQAELIKSVELAYELEINFLIIGSGSKVTLDSNFAGIIINNRSQNLKIYGVKGKVSVSGIGVEEAMIESDSGVVLSKLATYAAKQNLTGLEDLEVQNGTIGGSLSSNRQSLKFINQVKVLNKFEDVINKKIEQMEKEDIILSVVFKLKAKNKN